MRNARFWTVVAMIAGAALVRMLPHPWNFTPIGAMALFSGATFRSRAVAFGVPLAALFLSDLWIGLHSLMWAVYGSFALSIVLGMWLRGRRRVVPVAGMTFAGALLFFLITNWAVWLSGMTYPKTLAGLIACYVAGIPYFGNTLAGDAFYVAVLFGGLALLERRVPALREA
ncbi:MAG: DUF6580 family putative transport protein [Candidatus Acidiferrales bacterium]